MKKRVIALENGIIVRDDQREHTADEAEDNHPPLQGSCQQHKTKWSHRRVSVGIIALCLLILGGFILVIANLHHIAEDIESRVEIRVFKGDLSEQGIDQLGENLALEEVKR